MPIDTELRDLFKRALLLDDGWVLDVLDDRVNEEDGREAAKYGFLDISNLVWAD